MEDNFTEQRRMESLPHFDPATHTRTRLALMTRGRCPVVVLENNPDSFQAPPPPQP